MKPRRLFPWVAVTFAWVGSACIVAAAPQVPAAQATTEGLPCQSSAKSTGKVTPCVLDRDAAFYGQILPAKSTVFLTTQGQMQSFWLHENTRIQGHLLKASDDGRGNVLHPNGKLRAVWLAGDEEIDGVPCTTSGDVFKMGLGALFLGTQRMAWFYDDGHLQQAMVSRDVTIQGHAFRKRDIVSLGRDGKLDLTAARLR